MKLTDWAKSTLVRGLRHGDPGAVYMKDQVANLGCVLFAAVLYPAILYETYS